MTEEQNPDVHPANEPESVVDDAKDEDYAAEMKKTIGLPDLIEPGDFDFQFMFDPGSGPQLERISFSWDDNQFAATGCRLVAPNTRSSVSRQCPKTGANRLDRTTQLGQTARR